MWRLIAIGGVIIAGIAALILEHEKSKIEKERTKTQNAKKKTSKKVKNAIVKNKQYKKQRMEQLIKVELDKIKKWLDEYNNTLFIYKNERNMLFKELDKTRDKAQRSKIFQKIHKLGEERKILFARRDEIFLARDKLHAKLRTLRSHQRS
ncbi:hypothetical protein [Helicobacter cetorum]|uniref:hypothetical protein n=1 Tax=Helicobacter cetorum TaxID=138563 RepID=UPI000CF0E1B9|nr:hypothetical protein [Helicobacter cetorum]